MATKTAVDARGWFHTGDIARIAARLKDFPGYAKIPRVGVCEKPWTVECGLMTPTWKVRREKVLQTFESAVARLYAAPCRNGQRGTGPR